MEIKIFKQCCRKSTDLWSFVMSWLSTEHAETILNIINEIFPANIYSCFQKYNFLFLFLCLIVCWLLVAGWKLFIESKEDTKFSLVWSSASEQNSLDLLRQARPHPGQDVADCRGPELETVAAEGEQQ